MYISRAKAFKRRIVNEPDCISLLKKYNFNIIILEDYTFLEQISICANAQYIVSNHGAGLSNILFMKPSSSVLELRKENDYHNNCYFSLANAMSLNYYYQICAPCNKYQDAHIANLLVDIEALDFNINKMITQSSSIEPH